MCGPDTWLDDWSVAVDDDVRARARVRVNRLTVRWERTASLPDLLERADGLLGAERAAVRAAAGDRWIELEEGHLYRLEVAYPFASNLDVSAMTPPRDREDLGVAALAEGGRITQVSFVLRDLDEDAVTALRAALRARWGRGRTRDDETTWRESDRTITAELDGELTRITIRQLTRTARCGFRDGAGISVADTRRARSWPTATVRGVDREPALPALPV